MSFSSHSFSSNLIWPCINLASLLSSHGSFYIHIVWYLAWLVRDKWELMGQNFVGGDKKGWEVIKARQCRISNVRISFFGHSKNETFGTLSLQKEPDYVTPSEAIAWEKMSKDEPVGMRLRHKSNWKRWLCRTRCWKVLNTRHEVNGLNEAQEVVMTKEEEMRWWDKMKQDMRGRNETLRWRRQIQDKIKRTPEQNVGDDDLRDDDFTSETSQKLRPLLFYFPGAEKRVTPILHTRHLLPILLRTEYRTSLLTHRCVHGKKPACHKELLVTNHRRTSLLLQQQRSPPPKK